MPGIRAAVEARRDDMVAVSPIVAGAALKGPADRMLTELGHDASVVGVARLYAPLAATLVIDEADAGLAGAVEDAGMRCVVAPTVMHGPGRGGRPGPGWCSTRRRPESRPAVTGIALIPVEGIPEVRPGDVLAELIAARAELADGDVVVVTQKVVSKAEGRLVAVDPDDPRSHKQLVEDEAVRILRRRGDLIMTETSHGFVCANAGVDLSNVERG